MIDRLKRFFGGFFLNKYAVDNARRGMGGMFLGLLLALVVIVFALFGGYTVSFDSMYDDASDFKNTVREVFGGIGGLSVLSDRARANKVINTFDAEDDEIYLRHGIRVIVDTRPFDTTYGKFLPYYSDKTDLNDKDKRISAEQYAALDESQKSNYVFGIERSHEAVEPEYHIDEYEEYFSGLEDKGEEYEKLQEKRKDGGMSDRTYAEQLYVIYVKELYPEIGKFDSYGAAPTLRSYYLMRMEEVEDAKFFVIFDSGVFGNFVTDGGVPVGFSGVYSSLNGKTYGASAEQADLFIADAFSAAWSYNLNAYIMNGLSLVLFVVLTLIVCSCIYFAVCRLLRFGSGQSLGASINIVGSFFFISSLIAGAIIFGSSFALSREVMFNIAVPLFAGVVLVRTAVLAACEYFAHKKSVRENSEEIENSDGGESAENADNAENVEFADSDEDGGNIGVTDGAAGAKEPKTRIADTENIDGVAEGDNESV